MTYKIETVAQDNNKCGEAPIWDAVGGRILWTDNAGDVVYQLVHKTGQKKVISRNLMVAGIALNRSGELVFAGATGLHLWSKQDDYSTLAKECGGETLFLNDIIADVKGRLYAGTLYWGANGMEKLGKLYLVDTDSSMRVVDDGIELANGLGFSPDDKILYFTDSAARKIYAYDVHPQTGQLSGKRVFVQVPGNEGIPDGLTVDAQGFVWSAQWYGSQIVRYDPDGKVERRIEMPVKQVSSVAFGGEDLTDLYVTTAGDSWPSNLAPPGYDFNATNIGGSLYRIRLEIHGRNEHQTNFSRR